MHYYSPFVPWLGCFQIYKQTRRQRYPLIFDINLSNQGATNRLQYLVDGLYLDNATSTVNVYLITYNGEPTVYHLCRTPPTTANPSCMGRWPVPGQGSQQ